MKAIPCIAFECFLLVNFVSVQSPLTIPGQLFSCTHVSENVLSFSHRFSYRPTIRGGGARSFVGICSRKATTSPHVAGITSEAGFFFSDVPAPRSYRDEGVDNFLRRYFSSRFAAILLSATALSSTSTADSDSASYFLRLGRSSGSRASLLRRSDPRYPSLCPDKTAKRRRGAPLRPGNRDSSGQPFSTSFTIRRASPRRAIPENTSEEPPCPREKFAASEALE